MKTLAVRFVVWYDNHAHRCHRAGLPYVRLFCLMADVSYGYGPDCVGWERDLHEHPSIERWQRWLA